MNRTEDDLIRCLEMINNNTNGDYILDLSGVNPKLRRRHKTGTSFVLGGLDNNDLYSKMQAFFDGVQVGQNLNY